MASAQPRLTKDQLELLRRRLEEERTRLVAVLRAPLPAVDEERSELEETAQREAEQSDRLRLLDRERELLADVDRALARLREGRYGIDEETGEPIPYERLAAIPWARGRAD